MSSIKITIERPSRNVDWFTFSKETKDYLELKYRNLSFAQPANISLNELTATRFVSGKLEPITELYNELNDPESVLYARKKYCDENGFTLTYQLIP